MSLSLYFYNGIMKEFCLFVFVGLSVVFDWCKIYWAIIC